MQATSKIIAIPIKDVMDRLGIRYFSKTWYEYGIYDRWEKTSGRSFNTEKNIVHDFSNGRAEGDVFGFVKSHLSMTESETFKRFEDQFGIAEKKKVIDIWYTLPDLNNEQVDYLKKRGVKYEYVKSIVKNYQWGICCLIRDETWPIGGNARTLRQEHDKRFIGIAGYSTKWIYKSWIDDSKSYVIVVEWLIDFLTLRQFDTNVVWLKSADCWQDQIKELAKKYDVIVCNDNDQAGQKILDNLKGINYKRFDVSKYGDYKDINDLHKDLLSDEIIKKILENAQWFLPIHSSFQKLQWVIDIMKKNWQLWEDWPYQFMKMHQWFIKWKVYTIGAYSNTWKSKFSYSIAQRLLKQWKTIFFINLEVEESMCLLEIIKAHDKKTDKEVLSWHDAKQDDYKNLVIRDDVRDLQTICECIETTKPDYVFIDYVQNIQNKWGTDYEKHAKIAIELQATAIKTWCVMINLSQLSNSMGREMWKWSIDFVSLKWAWEYFACSDVIYVLSADKETPWEIEVSIAKNKFWPRTNDKIRMWADFAKNQFYIKDMWDNKVF